MNRPASGAHGVAFDPHFNPAGDAVPAEFWEGRPVAEWRALWGLDDPVSRLDVTAGDPPAGHESIGTAAPAPVLAIYDRAGSTNDIARRLAEQGAPTGSIVIADEQTAGRGRGGKSWLAPKGTALLFSIVLRPTKPLDRYAAPGATPIRVGLAAARAIERCAGIDVQLKWPNDLLVAGKGKLAGILCEGSLNDADGGYIVAGIGINVTQAPVDLDPATAQPATSLRAAAGRELDRGALVKAVHDSVLATIPGLTAPLDDAELAELAARDPLRGREITVDGRFAGTAHGIAPDGALTIIRRDGTTEYLRNGTVRPLPHDRSNCVY